MTERKVLHWQRREINQEGRKENRFHEEIESKVGKSKLKKKRKEKRIFICVMRW